MYSLFSLVARVVLICLSLIHFSSMKNNRETNLLYKLRDIITCFINLSVLTEIPLFILSLIYAFSVFLFDDCLCPFSWQLSLGTFVILLTWLELVVLSAPFQFFGVYALMLSRFLITFLKTSVLLFVLIAGFSLVFYLNNPYAIVG